MTGRRAVLVGAAGVLLAAAAALSWRLGWLPGRQRLNVLLISIDSLRADHLGCYGHRAEYAPEIPVSPNLDALAAEGVLFEDAWTTTSWTLPAHMALLTGLTDREHGVVNDDFALNARRQTAAQAFRAAEYATAGVYSGPYLDPKYGFGRGFDSYESAMLPPGQLAQLVEEQVRRRRAQGIPVTEQDAKVIRDRWSHWDVTSPRVNSAAQRFLEESRGGRPFFLFLHYFDSHYDYLPDRAEPGLGARFDPGYQGSTTGEHWWFDRAVRDPETGERHIGERDLRHVMALYDAEIHWVDRHIGQVFQKLKELGLWERTIVCVVSDHGDEFFEHGDVGHRSTLYEELCRIPWILRVPGATPPSRRIRELVRIYDVVPTLLDYAGLPPLPEAEGSSVRPVLEGRPDAPRSIQQRIFGMLWGKVNIRDGFRTDRYAVLRQFTVDNGRTTKDSPFLYVAQRQRDDGQGPLYYVFDRWQERGDRIAVSPRDARYAEALAAACRAFQKTEARAAALTEPHPALATEPSAAEKELLAAMGYVDAGQPETATRFLAPFPPPCPP